MAAILEADCAAAPEGSRGRAEANGDDARFSDAWPRASEDETGAGGFACLPSVAGAYADAVTLYWEAALRAGAVDSSQPLYVLEFGAGRGRFTWLFMRALAARLAAAPQLRLQPLHVAIERSEARAGFIAAHPYLAAQVEAGRLDTAVREAGDAGALRLRARRVEIGRAANPVVAICNGAFGDSVHDLFAFHYGELLEGRLRGPLGGDALDYAWRPVERADWLPRHWRPLLDGYAARVTSAGMLLPSGALSCVDWLAGLSAGRYLLIAADRGACEERQIRLGALAAPTRRHAERPGLPVNFHALSLHQQAQGAAWWNRRLAGDGIVVHAALRDDAGRIEARSFEAIADRLERAHPDDGAALRDEAGSADGAPARVLSLLRLSDFDPGVLQAALPRLWQAPLQLTPEALDAWRAALARVWSQHFPTGEFDTLHFDLGRLAEQLGDWGLAKRIFETGLALYGDDAAELYHLARCEAASGGGARAVALRARALEIDPACEACRALRDELDARLAARDALAWFHPEAACNEELRIEPLGAEHAEELRYQYRDPQIGIMTRLPELNSHEETVRWLDEMARERGRMSFAVVHAERGFVGAVCLHCDNEGAGYFHFWIGADYQDAGFGRRAARLLFAQAGRSGVRDIFTSVYRDNARSLRALEALGFCRVEVEAEPPDDDLVFFHRGGEAAARLDAARRLARLCAAIESPLVLRFAAENARGSRSAIA